MTRLIDVDGIRQVKDIKPGDIIYIKGTVEAFRTGFRKKECRININGITMWVDIEQIK